MAETLTGPEADASTCYESAGWIPVSHTVGFTQHHCNSRIAPKRIWLKLLDPQAKEILCSPELSARHAAALNKGIGACSTLSAAQRSSLKEALHQMTDPRDTRGKRYPLAATLTILALGLLAGKVRLPEIIRFGTRLSHVQRQALGFWPKTGTGLYPAPTRNVLRKLLLVLDLAVLTDVLTRWVQSQAGLLPSSLILGRKTIRNRLDCILSRIACEKDAAATLITVSSKSLEPPATQ